MHIVVIGAGPTGLAAGYDLLQNGHQVTLYEQDPRWVGGISRTVVYKGYRFDIGGHRFFSKNAEIEAYWRNILGEDLLTRRRLSRIFYDGKFYDYPLKAGNAFKNMGLVNTAGCLGNYLKTQMFPRRPVRTFEDWVTNHFGARLYEMFFKSYTEKVWGMPCNEISADWAAQRIQGLSLITAVKSAVWPSGFSRQKSVKTLADSFRYPKQGPGMLWERVASHIRSLGGDLRMGARVSCIAWEPGRGVSAVEASGCAAQRPDHVISSMPLRSLVRALSPQPPLDVRDAAEALHYRDFITVALIVDAPHLFPDQWIYIHDPRVKVGRIQNFKNWSADMVPDPGMTCLGMEYFCFAGDGLWTAPDRELLSLAEREARATGLLGKARCVDGTVVRVPKAYPVYDDHYERHLLTIRRYLDSHLPNLQIAGRNGMHRYNNQDHAMLTGLMAAKNVSGAAYDLWAVNSDAQYLESVPSTRRVPQRITVKG